MLFMGSFWGKVIIFLNEDLARNGNENKRQATRKPIFHHATFEEHETV